MQDFRGALRANSVVPILVLTVAVLTIAGAAIAGDGERVNPFAPSKARTTTGFNNDPAYTGGPNICADCHQQEFEDWLAHGHARKIGLAFDLDDNKDPGDRGNTTNVRSAGFPMPSHNPDVYNWDNVLFVVGASKYWKTRYVGLDGYFLTEGGKNQYNWQTGSFTNYNADVQMKPFDCGTCHTTGYNPEGTTFQDDFDPPIPGIIGDFAHLNITCEACHGPGAEHAAAPSSDNIVVDTSAAACGSCHTRGSDPQVVLASGSFIRHHEQWPELNNSPHAIFSCGSCHDPHVGRARGVGDGQTEICGNCHPSEVAEYEGSGMEAAGVTCQDCHMGKATKSAVAMGPYEGDVWTHLFEIDSSADYDMFNRDGEGNAVSAKGAISLEYACFRCHAAADKAAYAAIGDDGTAYHTLGQ